MTRRFFVPEIADRELIELDHVQARHLLHVLRGSAGDSIVLFDGSGYEYEATVEQTGKRTAHVRVHGKRWVDREPSRRVTLAVAMPKGDRQDWLVQKATELGVARLVPWITQRSVATAKTPERAEKMVERWQRIVIEACKQCERNRLMQIDRPTVLAQVLERHADAQRLLATARPDALPEPLRTTAPMSWTEGRDLAPDRPVVLGVGPEGGWTDEELVQAADAGWRLVHFGPRILRTETAAIAAAAALLLGD